MHEKIIYQNILNSMDNGVITIDFNGKISTFNNAALDMMGLKKGEAIGKIFNDVLFRNEYDDDFIDVLIDLVQKEKKKLHREINFTKPDNTKIPLGINTSILEDKNGKEIGIIVVLTDMSLLQKTKFLQDTFSRYVTKQVVQKIIENPEEYLGLKGQKVDVTVLFSDIRGFTSLSESLPPSEVVNLLNNYFSKMIDIVFEYKGTIDKFMGDGMMCIFGAPISMKNHAEMALKASVKMKQALKEINEKRKKPIKIGIGINSGQVVVGNIGSDRRLEYTVIGDNVNIAARLEKRAKNDQILLSGSTYDLLKDKIKVREYKPIKFKGKSKKVRAYKFINFKNNRQIL